MNRGRISLAAALAVGALAVSACNVDQYRAETKIGPDGRVSRAIYQPESATPAAARKRGLWKSTTYAGRISGSDWHGSIADLPHAKRDDDHKYFAAWGEFASTAKLPRAYVLKVPGLRDGELVVDYAREDLGLLIAHRWKETLTESFSLRDMRDARRELVDGAIPLGERTLARFLGDGYDTSALVAWGEQSGRAWFYEVTDATLAGGGLLAGPDRLEVAFGLISARYGLNVLDDSAQPLKSDAWDAAVDAFVRQLLREKIHRRDGQPVPEAKIAEIAQWAFGSRPEGSEQRFKPYDDAAEAEIAAAFGSQEKADERFAALGSRILGLYGQGLDVGEFVYSLELPGQVVQTNGKPVSKQAVRWSFGTREAFPAGYAMECRSLEVRTEQEQALLGRAVLVDDATLRSYESLATQHPELRTALVASAAAKSLEPFQAARRQPALSPETTRAFDEMAKLLGLAPKP